MNVTTLIVYATNSSGTLIASELVRDVLLKHGHAVTLQRANEVQPQELKRHDLVILASCSWERFEGKKRLDGQLQQHMYELSQKLTGKIFPGKRFAVFGLGDSSYTHFCGAVDKLVQLVDDLGGELVGEALKIDGWFFHPERNEKFITEWANELVRVVA